MQMKKTLHKALELRRISKRKKRTGDREREWRSLESSHSNVGYSEDSRQSIRSSQFGYFSRPNSEIFVQLLLQL